jgi:membrane protein
MSEAIILFKEIFRRFWRDRCLVNAQALTYNTVFALVPLLAFGISMVRFFIGTEEILSRINEALSQVLNPGALNKAQEVILRLIQQAENAPLGTASMIIFITMVLGLLMQFEDVLNQIFRVKDSRSYVQRATVYWMGLTLGPLLVAFPLGMTVYLTKMGLQGMGLVSLVLKFWTIPSVILLFSIIFLYLPAQRIKVSAAVLGATTAGILWVLAASGYAFYTSKAVTYSKLYGSLSTIPLFLLWLWVNWCIVLLGAEVAGVFNQRRAILIHYRARKGVSWFFLGLGAMLRIYLAYFRGEDPPRVVDLAELLQASPFELEKILDKLEKAGLLQNFAGLYHPTRAADTLALTDIQRALEGNLPEEIPSEPVLKVPHLFLRQREDFWKSKTFKELLIEVLKEGTHGQVSDLPSEEGHGLHPTS